MPLEDCKFLELTKTQITNPIALTLVLRNPARREAEQRSNIHHTCKGRGWTIPSYAMLLKQVLQWVDMVKASNSE